MNKKVLFTIEEVQDFFKDFNVNKFSYDTECTSLRYDKLEITGASFCDGKNACYIPINSSANLNHVTCVESDIVFKFLNETAFANDCKDKIVVAHNIVFDGMVVSKYGAYLWDAKVLFDTMVASHLINENRASKGLKQLTKEELGIEATKFTDVGKNHYTKQFFEYGMDDAINTWNLAVHFSKQLKEKKLMKLMTKVESDFMKCLIEMKIEGIDVDKEFLEKTTVELREASMKFKKELYGLLGEKYSVQVDLEGDVIDVKGAYNFDSPKQLSEIMFDKLGLEVVETTETGQRKTGKVTINKYKKDIPFVAKLNEYKICSKLLHAFFEPLPGFIQNDGKIRPSFMDCGTVTGRLACREPNLQQQPKSRDEFPIETRQCFVVPKGYKMFSCDYSGQELRVMAHLSDEPGMIEAFNNGADLHLSVANDVWNLGIPPEACSKKHPDYKKYKKDFEKERFNAKAVNFGLAYGISATGLSKNIGCTEKEAQEVIDSYFKKYTSLDKAIKHTHTQIKDFGYVRNLFGRYRHFTKNDKGYYDGRCYRQSFNFKIQSSSADMIRVASNKCFRVSRENPEWGMKMIATVHDEVVMKCREEFIDEATKAVKEAFESAVSLKIPITADIGVGNNYAEAK